MRFFSAGVLCCVALAVIGCSRAADNFDENRAFGLLEKQVDLGPRYPGSSGHEAAASFIESQLKSYADSVSSQEFSEVVNGKTVRMHNIIAHFNPRAKRWVLLAAHWDTRPIADQEIDPDKKKMPIVGANDGASGVAVLLELARVFAKQKPDVGVVMAFLDGEDYGTTAEGMFLGSKHLAANLEKGLALRGKPIKIDYGILLDMVGDKNLKIHKEENSVNAAPDVVEKVWAAAKELGYKDKFVPQVGFSIQDDHVPLIRAGVRCIDIIDFDYGPWHTLDDTPDKCSAESLKTVGEVVAHVIYTDTH